MDTAYCGRQTRVDIGSGLGLGWLPQLDWQALWVIDPGEGAVLGSGPLIAALNSISQRGGLA